MAGCGCITVLRDVNDVHAHWAGSFYCTINSQDSMLPVVLLQWTKEVTLAQGQLAGRGGAANGSLQDRTPPKFA